MSSLFVIRPPKSRRRPAACARALRCRRRSVRRLRVGVALVRASRRTGSAAVNGMSFALTPSPSGTLCALEEAGDGLLLDVDDVVGQPAAVREAGVVAAEHAHPVRVRPTAGSTRLIRSSSAKVVPGVGHLRDARCRARRRGRRGSSSGRRACRACSSRRPGSASCSTSRTARRASGVVRFQRSFSPVGMTTSLISGSPRRETCVQPR